MAQDQAISPPSDESYVKLELNGEDMDTTDSDGPPTGTRHVAQIAATSMTRILGFTKRFPPAEVVIWWNDVVSWIDALLVSSGLDPYVAFASIILLERYAKNTDKPIAKLDTYFRLFVASLMVASKIICPRQVIPWERILGDAFIEDSICWLEREFLITIGWDVWMMDIVDEVWRGYDKAVMERLGDPNKVYNSRDSRAKSWASSSFTSPGPSEDGSSIIFPSPILLSPLRGHFDGLPPVARARTTSSLWEGYMSDRTRPENLEIDLDQYIDTIQTAPYVCVEKASSDSKILRTRLSRIFRQK